MLSQTSEHALRAVLHLAQRRPGESVPAEAIATALGAPANYLAKTLNALAKRGIVSSMRGPAGGFRLAADPAALTVAEVVAGFDEPRTGGMCLLGGRPCRSERPCAAHVRWTEVKEDVWAPLRRTTIADLLRGRAEDQSIPAGGSAGTHGRAECAA